MDIKHIVHQWGYWAVFLGALVEGETVILSASALAAAGYLSIIKVAIIAFLGTLIADQGLFFMGYYYGEAGLQKLLTYFPRFRPYLDKGFRFLQRYQTTYILIFRFIYGVRIISPVIIGSQKMDIQRFALLNLIAAVIWTLVSCSAGYFLGEMVMHLNPAYAVILGIVGISTGVWFFQWRKRKKAVQPSPDLSKAPESKAPFRKDIE